VTALKELVLSNMLKYKLVKLESSDFGPGAISTMFADDIDKIKTFGGEFIGSLVAGVTIFICSIIIAA